MNLPDTTSINFIAAFLNKVDPSWSLVSLAILGGVVYLLILLVKNTKLTEAVSKRLVDNTTAETVKLIREDQLKSNTERKAQGETIDKIDGRLTTLEAKVEKMACKNAETCVNRKVD